MNRPANFDVARKATNVTLSEELVAEAKRLGVNISKACERGLVAKVREAKGEQWLSDNRAALDWSNSYVEQHGIPFSDHRKF